MQITKIKPRSGWININWGELLQYRELLFFLVWRDILVRYKQTVLGVAWAVLQPVFLMVVFSVIFGRLAKIDSEGFPYSVYVYAGLLPWTFFAGSVTQSSLSLVNQQNLLTKIYFPRLFVPTACVGAALVDLGFSCLVYAGILYYHQIVPTINAVFVPGLILLTIIAALGFGYTLSALTVVYRDFRFVIPFMIQALMYLSPVVYPSRMIPEKYQLYLALNPMTGIIDAYRWAILGTPFKKEAFLISTGVALFLFTYGLFYFRKTERRFADIA